MATFSPETGKLEMEYPISGKNIEKKQEKSGFVNFQSLSKLPLNFVFLGRPYSDFFYFDKKGLNLRCIHKEMEPRIEPVKFGKNTDKKKVLPFVGQRQESLL
jgi:hypothetical protein